MGAADMRPSDSARGARIALEIADARRADGVLFDEELPLSFWDEIAELAAEVLAEEEALKAALKAGA